MSRFLAYLRSVAALRRVFRTLARRRRQWTLMLDAMHDRLEREPHRETILAARERQALYARIEELDHIEEAILYGSGHE
jgi:hypothetical protein